MSETFYKSSTKRTWAFPSKALLCAIEMKLYAVNLLQIIVRGKFNHYTFTGLKRIVLLGNKPFSSYCGKE